MTFISRPTYLNSLFSSFEYQSIVVGNDNITISIYDGIGGECLTQNEHMNRYKQYNLTSPYTIYSNNHQMNSRNNNNNISSDDHDDQYYHHQQQQKAPISCHKVTNQIPINIQRIRSSHDQKQTLHGMNKIIHIIQEVPIQLWFAIIALITSFGLIAFISFYCKIQKQFKERIKDHTLKGYNTSTTTKTNIDNGSSGKKKRKRERKKLQGDGGGDDGENRMTMGVVGSSSSSDGVIKEEKEIKKKKKKKNLFIDDDDDDDDNSVISSPADTTTITTPTNHHDLEEQEQIIDRSSTTSTNNCEWIQYLDTSSGDYYYENVRTRRVTWTKPTSPFANYEG